MGESETQGSLWRNNITSFSPHPFENPEHILVFLLPIHPAFSFISCRLLTFLTFSFRWPNFLRKLCRNPALWTPRVCSTTGSTALAKQHRAPSVQWTQPWVSRSHTTPKGPFSAYLRKGTLLPNFILGSSVLNSLYLYLWNWCQSLFQNHQVLPKSLVLHKEFNHSHLIFCGPTFNV